MIPTREMVIDAKKRSIGIPVAYVDRIQYMGRIKGRVDEADTRIPLFRSAKQLPDLAQENNWKSVWSGLKKEPRVAAAAICHGLMGIGNVAIDRALKYIGLKIENDDPSPGRLLSLNREQGVLIGEVLMPTAGGGSKLVRVACKGDVGTTIGVGGAVDLYKRQGNHTYYRMRRPYVTPSYNGGTKHFSMLDAKEVADVVKAQYQNLDFSGHWERRSEVSDIIEQDFPRYPRQKCAYFRNTQTGDGILVFRGTDPSDVGDHAVNFLAMHGISPSQYRDAPEIAKMVKSRFGGSVIVAGHSKGGGIAQYVGMCTGIRAVCFNAVGLPTPLIEKAQKKGDGSLCVDHFLIRYDWVSNVAGVYRDSGMAIAHPFTDNSQYLVGGKGNVHFLDSQHSRSNFIALHSMSTIAKCLADDPHLLKEPFGNIDQPSVGGVVRVKDMVPRTKTLQGRTFTQRDDPRGRAIKKNL